MAAIAEKIRSFDEIAEGVGIVHACNSFFAARGYLPEEKFEGQYFELVGLPGLNPGPETWIKSNCSR